MKRIEFIAPVEAMRGNLSGKQDLVYPESDNKAYESPVGSVNYARNYRPSFIGAKRAKDGLKYFNVKTKAAYGMTALSKRNMALLGGVGAIVGAILANSAFKLRVDSIYSLAKAAGTTDAKSTRQFISEKIRVALAAKAEIIDISYMATHFRVHNPWVYTGAAQTGVEDLSISQAVLVRFWGILATSPIYFNVEGMKGVAHNGDSFGNVISSRYNVLGLSIDSSVASGMGNIKFGDSYVCTMYEGDYTGCGDTEEVSAVSYVLTEDPHEQGG